MSDSLITKKALANSLKEITKTKSLSKISIKDIVDGCGLNRQTFYYHFKDKFDLVNWVYCTESNECIANNRYYNNWTLGMLKMLNYFIENKSFYTNILKTKGQNSFSEYLFDYAYELIMSIINYLCLNKQLSKKDKNFICRFYTHSFVGTVVDWIQCGMLDSPESIVNKIEKTVEGSIFEAVSRFIED
jgi:probable dihydroxyacetone kinase regulator